MDRLGTIAGILLIAISAFGAVAEEHGFVLRPGDCPKALASLWEELSPDLHPTSAGPVVTIETGGEFVSEARVVLEMGSQGLLAHTFEITGLSLCKQLEDLQDSNRYPTLEEATAAVEVCKRTAKGDGELKKLYEKLPSIEVRMDPSSDIFLPSRGYEVRVTGLTGQVSVSYVIPEPTAERVAFSGSTRLPNPELRAWVQDVLGHLHLGEGTDCRRKTHHLEETEEPNGKGRVEHDGPPA